MKKLTTIALLLTALLTGCANVDGEPANRTLDDASIPAADGPLKTANTLSKPVEFAPTFEKNGTEGFPTKCKTYKQKAKLFTEEQLLAFFSETPERTYYSESNTTVYDAETEGGNTDGWGLNFSTDAGLFCATSYDAVGTLYEGEEIKNAGLGFASLDEVLEEIGKKMTELGLSSEDWYVDEVYTLTKDDLERHKEARYKAMLDNPYDLDEADLQKELEGAERIKKYPCKDQYYISLGFKLDNINVLKDMSIRYGGNMSNSIIGSRCKFSYSEDGLEGVWISHVCETETSEDVEIIAPDKAKELINKKYSDIIFDGEVEVNGVELVYLPISQNDLDNYNNNFETRPAYVFYCTVTDEFYGEMRTQNKITYFDAVTGNEVATLTISGDFIGYGG